MKNEKKILVVEDELAHRLALHDKLEKVGFSVIEARNGITGLEAAEKERPSAVVLDVMMPKMDGIEMIKEMRKKDWGKNIPVVMLTNVEDVNTIKDAMENDVFEYFVKSNISLEKVIEKVEELAK